MDMPLGARFANASDSRAFMLAGNAHVTLVSTRTGVRFTFQVRQPDATTPHFVAVLTGPDHYTYLGTIFGGRVFKHGVKSPIGGDAPSAKAFAWAWPYIARGETPPDCEVWHEGSCGKCGRQLTDPESIASGLGPICGGRS